MLLRSEGRLIRQRVKENYQALLFSLGDFFVEIWFDMERYSLVNMVIHKDNTLLDLPSSSQNVTAGRLISHQLPRQRQLREPLS